MHTREDAIRSTRGSDLGLKTVRFQDPVGDMGKVVDVRVQHAFTEAVLDQLAANGADVKGHRRKLKKKSKMLQYLKLSINPHIVSKANSFRPVFVQLHILTTPIILPSNCINSNWS